MADGNSSHPTSDPAAADPGGNLPVPWPRMEAFVGQFIHDIRNGLNAIELQLTFLGEISTDPEAVEEVKRLRGTVGDLTRQLQAVKIACSTVSPHPMAYPASDFFEDLRERLGRLYPETADAVRWDVNVEASDSLLVDPDLSINGLLELFKNTFCFGGTNTRCTVRREGSRILFVLHETMAAAPAIAPERWGREPLLTSRRGAYGLGLYRARQIFEVQGGTMEATYVADDHVLTTAISLPRPTAAD